ncbi:MAG: hypothetical protein NW214_02515 [Pseudanabaenaceae cyanobacterium bins.39]|nr:hypothetical protein [Pseudanabaenaceae cyanobacterium bins.39]
MNQGQQLEDYSRHHPQEVLLVKLKSSAQDSPNRTDEVMIFKGFSSSLTRSTAFDPDVPVIADRDVIISIDRLVAPYKPNQPNYIQQGLTWEQFQHLL